MEKNNILKLVIGVVALVLVACRPAFAQISQQAQPSSYKLMRQVQVPADLVVPTVLEFPVYLFDVQDQRFALYEVETSSFVKSVLKTASSSSPVTIMNNGEELAALHDDSRLTYTDFPASDLQEITTVITYETVDPIRSSTLELQLDLNVRQPASVTIYAGEQKQLVVTDKLLTNGNLYFPETLARHWEVYIKHTQPLRIQEMHFLPSAVSISNSYSIRFLAQPHNTYYLYMKPNTGVIDPVVPYVDLENVSGGVRTTSALPAVSNPAYVQGDQDGDLIADAIDNCPAVANQAQTDVDKNNVGDACEDFDHDTVMNSVDNCPKNPNIDQTDADGDTFGDVCDPEESRLTERYWWLPWGGIFVGFAVVFFIFANTVKSAGKKDT